MKDYGSHYNDDIDFGVRKDPFWNYAWMEGMEPDIDTLRAMAREPIRRCDCCGGHTKVYRRKLNSGMAAIACWMAANRGREWVSVNEMPRYCANSNEVSKLMHWELAEQKPNTNTGKRTSGVWRLTATGVLFAHDAMTVPSHAFLSSPGNVLLGFEDAHVGVREALGRHFNYAELMTGGGR